MCVCVCVPTYDLDDLCQQDSIGDVLAQVLDEALTAGLGQVVVGPVGVDLQRHNKHPVSFCVCVCVRGTETERRCAYVTDTVGLLFRAGNRSSSQFILRAMTTKRVHTRARNARPNIVDRRLRMWQPIIFRHPTNPNPPPVCISEIT